jgi:pimeloyl-ACP methyl ester carboxylesterase
MGKSFFIHLLLAFACFIVFVGCKTNPSSAPPHAAVTGRPSTYVIVHGAWGGGWDWKHVADLLTADGNTVYRPTLTGLGEHSNLAGTNIDLDTHIQDIVNVILWENLHDVVLVGHSYGGMVITGVADRVPDRIKHVVYLDALLPENGECVDAIKSNRIKTSVANGFVMGD